MDNEQGAPEDLVHPPYRSAAERLGVSATPTALAGQTPPGFPPPVPAPPMAAPPQPTTQWGAPPPSAPAPPQGQWAPPTQDQWGTVAWNPQAAGYQTNSYAPTGVRKKSGFSVGRAFAFVALATFVLLCGGFLLGVFRIIRHPGAEIGDCVALDGMRNGQQYAKVVPCAEQHVGHIVAEVSTEQECAAVAPYWFKLDTGNIYCVSNNPY